ncbi:MAG: SH3 domain-containing protein [Lachnospiraceae bacterium]|nr:SH3 domain-containing protein [Lachnospiraceae bacterium]
MNTSNNNIQDFLKAKLEIFRNWLFRHSKVIMPVVLVLCVAGTVAVAISANKRKVAEEQGAEVSEGVGVEVADNLIAVPEVPLQQDAVPEINELFSTYYTAMAEGDTDTMSRLVDHLDATEILRAQETSKYIESYPTLEVYTKAGPREGTFVAYVYTEVKFKDYEKPIPGMRVYYVCTNESGEYYINEDGEENEAELNYIRELNLQDDVVDLNNKTAVAYNNMLAEDEVMAGFIVDLNAEIDKNVGEALARAEGSSSSGETGDAEGGEPLDELVGGSEMPETEEPAVVVTKVKAIDVVNIRTSDSETADKLGKAAVGDEFTLLEEKGNGWSKISYEDGEAYIKSEFLEPSETMQADAGATEETPEETEDTSDDEETEDQPQADESSTAQTTGTVTVKENVRVRASASENGKKLGTAYVGEKLDVIMKQADGWTKIKYNGQTAYVKSDYVE